MLKNLFLSVSLITIITGCGAGGAGSDTASPGVIPSNNPGPDQPALVNESADISLWRSKMLEFGRKLCDKNKIKELSTWEGNVWYYDGARVFYQIADYTGDKSFEKCAEYVLDVYREYVLSNNGALPGWRVFPHGLAINFRRTGNTDSKRAVSELSVNSAFARSAGGPDFELSRETAYLINTYTTAAQLGEPVSANLATAVANAKSHIKQWLTNASYVKPFMTALTAEALISYAYATSDKSVLADLPQLVKWLRENAWSSKEQAFRYIVCRKPDATAECQADDAGPAVDLNLLIAPVFAYVALVTNDTELAKFSDSIFNSGVRNAYLNGGKQFSQNYRWSFDYVKWRSQI